MNAVTRAGVTVGQENTATRPGRKLWPATVTGYEVDPATQTPTAYVIIDGDPEPKQPHAARVMLPQPLTSGDRVMIEFDPPLGIYVAQFAEADAIPVGRLTLNCTGGVIG